MRIVSATSVVKRERFVKYVVIENRAESTAQDDENTPNSRVSGGDAAHDAALQVELGAGGVRVRKSLVHHFHVVVERAELLRHASDRVGELFERLHLRNNREEKRREEKRKRGIREAEQGIRLQQLPT